jgi:transposase
MVIVAGIDVSKQWLDVALWPKKERLRVERDEAGFDRLAAWLRQHEVARVGLEATGGFEIAVIDALEDRGFEVVRHNALRVRRLAEAMGRLAKNDRADALAVAKMTALSTEAKAEKRRRDLDPLNQLLLCRDQLIEWVNDCRNQLEHLTDKRLRQRIAARQAGFKREVLDIDRKVADLIAENPDWRETERRLRTVPGVGPLLAATLIARLPELGRLSRRAVAALVGLAPFDHDSGSHRGERHIGGGRFMIRRVLYMAAIAARRCNPAIAAFAGRLAGKKPKVIIVACMRKLIVTLNAMLRDRRDWQDRPALTPVC